MSTTGRGQLFEFAVLYHPKPTKDQADRNEYPKSVVVVEPQRVIGQEAEVPMLAARAIPPDYADKLGDCEIVVRPF